MLRLRFCSRFGVWLTAAFLLAAPAGASIVEALDLEELTAQADCIVLGRVVWTEPILHADGRISTWSRIVVERVLRGSGMDQGEILVETLGGQIGNVGMRVEGEPSFAVGDRAVVFVRGDETSIFRPVGMAQGVMRVRGERGSEMVAPTRQGGLALVRRNEKGALVRSKGPLAREERLELFLSRVRDIVRAQDGDADGGSGR